MMFVYQISLIHILAWQMAQFNSIAAEYVETTLHHTQTMVKTNSKGLPFTLLYKHRRLQIMSAMKCKL